jgi:hypothetical protein
LLNLDHFRLDRDLRNHVASPAWVSTTAWTRRAVLRIVM